MHSRKTHRSGKCAELTILSLIVWLRSPKFRHYQSVRSGWLSESINPNLVIQLKFSFFRKAYQICEMQCEISSCQSLDSPMTGCRQSRRRLVSMVMLNSNTTHLDDDLTHPAVYSWLIKNDDWYPSGSSHMADRLVGNDALCRAAWFSICKQVRALMSCSGNGPPPHTFVFERVEDGYTTEPSSTLQYTDLLLENDVHYLPTSSSPIFRFLRKMWLHIVNHSG